MSVQKISQNQIVIARRDPPELEGGVGVRSRRSCAKIPSD